MATKNLLIRGGADFSGVKKEIDKTQKTLSNFQSSVSSTMKKIGVVLGALAIGSLVKDSTELAMGVESAINQINRTMGDSAGAFKKWASEQGKSYGMATADALKYGAVYSNLISGFTKDTSETTKYTEQLLKSSAIVASATGRTMEDTMERIRSGLLGNTESIEDLGINVNVAMIQSTNAFKQFANGKSWLQLDYQTQQQIRLMAILEQANVKYGNSLANTTATQMQMFRAELKNVQLSLGQAFLPILNTILPILTVLISKLAYAMNVFSQFTQALFGKSSQTQAQAKATSSQAAAVSGLGDAIKNTGKEAKKAQGSLAGFDEINSLNKNSGSNSDSGTTPGTATSVPGLDAGGIDNSTSKVTQKIKDMADNVKKVLKDLAVSFVQNKEIITSAIAGLIAGFAAFQIITNWSAIVAAFEAAFAGLGAAISAISLPVLAIAAAIALVVANLVYLWQTNDAFRDSVLEAWNTIATFVTTLVNDMWAIIKDIWNKYGQTLIDNLSGFMQSIRNIIVAVWEGFLKPTITKSLELLSSLWSEHLKGVVSELGECIMKLINGALEIWNKFFSPIITWLIEKLGPVFSVVFGSINQVLSGALGFIADIVKSILKIFGGLIDFITGVFTGNWAKAWEGIKNVISGIFDGIITIFKVPLNFLISAMNFLIRGINKFKIDVPDWVPVIGGSTFGFDIPEIPKMARGGIVDSATPFIAGEAGKEVVMPLENNTEWIDILANKLNSLMGNSAAEVILMLNEIELGKATINAQNRVNRIAGTTLQTV